MVEHPEKEMSFVVGKFGSWGNYAFRIYLGPGPRFLAIQAFPYRGSTEPRVRYPPGPDHGTYMSQCLHIVCNFLLRVYVDTHRALRIQDDHVLIHIPLAKRAAPTMSTDGRPVGGRG